jgi:hypothetical protein
VFTYWDYRAGMFHQDLGMRVDLVLATGPVAERVRGRRWTGTPRKDSGPSDHAPVIVDLDEAPDGDIGPVVPPPSAPATPEGDPAAERQTLRVPLRKWSQTTGLNPPRLSAVACDHLQVRKASAFLRIDADILRS